MKYKNYNDYELIYMVKENDDFSYDALYKKYMPIIKSIAYDFYIKYKNYGYEFDDFVQEAYLSFHNAIKHFDEQKDVLFYTFSILCIRRSLISFSRRITSSKKNISNENFVSLDEYDCIGESNIDFYSNYNDLVSMLKNLILSLEFEDACILELRYNGFSFTEISSLLDLSLRHIQFRSKNIKRIINSQLMLKMTN